MIIEREPINNFIHCLTLCCKSRYEAIIRPVQKLYIENFHIVPTARIDGILINLPQRTLYFFRGGKLLLNYPVGLGRPSWPTPEGDFTVLTKVENKCWVVPKSIQEEMQLEGAIVKTKVPPGPENPLGKLAWL